MDRDLIRTCTGMLKQLLDVEMGGWNQFHHGTEYDWALARLTAELNARPIDARRERGSDFENMNAHRGETKQLIAIGEKVIETGFEEFIDQEVRIVCVGSEGKVFEGCLDRLDNNGLYLSGGRTKRVARVSIDKVACIGLANEKGTRTKPTK